MMPERIHTGNAGEKIGWLPLTGTGQAYKPLVLYSVKLTDIHAGDLISVKAYGELTNDLGYNVMLAWQTNLANAPDATSALAEVTEGKGYNITPDAHHGDFHDADDYVFSKDYPEVFVNVVVKAASTAAALDGSHKLKVEQDYGRLSILLFRKA